MRPAGAAGAGAGGAGRRRAPSPLIYPAETIPLAFDHAQHARLGATLRELPPDGADVDLGRDNLIPREAACRSCHKIDRAQPPRRCRRAQGPRAATPATSTDGDRGCRARASLRPSRRGSCWRGRTSSSTTSCTRRAASAARSATSNADTQQAPVTRADLPMMATCLGCHDGKQATARCSACHLTEPDGRLKTKLVSAATMAAGGDGPLVPSGSLRGIDAHGPTFKRDHARRARGELLPDVPQAQRVHRLPRRRRDARPTFTRPTTCRCTRLTRAATRPTVRHVTARSRSVSAATSARGWRPIPRGDCPGGGQQPVRHRDRAQELPPARVGARRDRRVRRDPALDQPFAGRPAQHPHLRLLPPRGELPRLPFGRPDPGADLLAPRARLRLARRVVGSWRPATSAPASSVTPVGRWNSTCDMTQCVWVSAVSRGLCTRRYNS